jgi:hypothetical protein
MTPPVRALIPLLVVTIVVARVATQSTKPVTVIAYGDTRFTDPSNVTATHPRARGALIARIAEERPDAVVISGDVPWHGGVANDYAQYRIETATWRAAGIRVLPALGNHEFSQCKPQECVENWWAAFPELRGQRWYASDIGDHTRVLTLDTMSALTPGSAQRLWLEHEVQALPPTIDFLLIALHHPPVADIQTRVHVDHNPRPNEIALAEYLKGAAAPIRARVVVLAGHIHNYERLLRDDVMYLVTGGGGAAPHEIDRTPQDLYQGIDFPNYHYVKLTIAAGALKGEMFRLDEAAARAAHFTLKDSFELSVRQPSSK